MVNVAVSGWSGVGSTSVTLVLALLLKRKYVYVGSVFRYLGEKLGYNDEGMSRIEADLLLEREIGKIMDRYVDWVLVNEDNVILESDLSVFRIGKHKNVFSIFLKAPLDKRANRVIDDKREDAVRVLAARDEVHKELYQELWLMDYFDEELINEKYWEVLNSGEMTMLETVRELLVQMSRFPGLEAKYDWPLLSKEANKWIELFVMQGKGGLRNELEKQNLLVNHNEIFEQLVELFGNEINELPLAIRRLIISNKYSQVV